MLRIAAFLVAALVAVLGGSLAAGPAAAQIGSIFGDAPPRPPSNVPNTGFPPQPPPVQYPNQYPNPSPFPPPSGARAPSAIEAQPLPPPPGAALAPAAPDQGMQQPPVQRARVTPGFAAPQPQPQPANLAPGQPGNPASPPIDSAPQPDDTVITEMPSQKIANGRAVFSGLDKITGRIISFDSAIGETVQFGALQVTARVCYTRPPTESANTDAFVEVDEVTLQGEIKRIFTGWMFAASPGLHAVEHPIYDVWLTDCAAPVKVAEPAPPPTPVAATPPPARQRQKRPPAPPPAVPVQPR
jgi:hypothetical protein